MTGNLCQSQDKSHVICYRFGAPEHCSKEFILGITQENSREGGKGIQHETASVQDRHNSRPTLPNNTEMQLLTLGTLAMKNESDSKNKGISFSFAHFLQNPNVQQWNPQIMDNGSGVADHRSAVLLELVPDGKLSKILLENQSTVNLICNPKLLTNILEANLTVDVRCITGKTMTNLIGDLVEYGTVWLHPNGIANILSLA